MTNSGPPLDAIREEADNMLVDYLASIRQEFADDIDDLEAAGRERLIGEGYPVEQATFVAAAPRLLRALLDQLQEQAQEIARLTAIIEALQEEP